MLNQCGGASGVIWVGRGWLACRLGLACWQGLCNTVRRSPFVQTPAHPTFLMELFRILSACQEAVLSMSRPPALAAQLVGGFSSSAMLIDRLPVYYKQVGPALRSVHCRDGGVER